MIPRKRGRPPKLRPAESHTAVEPWPGGYGIRLVTRPGPKPKLRGRPKAKPDLVSEVIRRVDALSVRATVDSALSNGRLMQRWRASDRLYMIGDAVHRAHLAGESLRGGRGGRDGAYSIAARAFHCSEGTARRAYTYWRRFSG